MSLAITLALVALAVTSTFSAGLELLRGRDRRAVVGLLLVNVALVPALAWLLLQIFDPERSVHRAGGSSPSPLVERARPLLARSAGARRPRRAWGSSRSRSPRRCSFRWGWPCWERRCPSGACWA